MFPGLGKTSSKDFRISYSFVFLFIFDGFHRRQHEKQFSIFNLPLEPAKFGLRLHKATAQCSYELTSATITASRGFACRAPICINEIGFAVKPENRGSTIGWQESFGSHHKTPFAKCNSYRRIIHHKMERYQKSLVVFLWRIRTEKKAPRKKRKPEQEEKRITILCLF